MKIAIIGHGSLTQNIIKWLSEQEIETVWFTSKPQLKNEELDFPYLKIIHEPISRIQKEFEEEGIEMVPLRDLFWVVTKTQVFKADEAWGNLPLEVQKDMLRPMEKYESVDAIIEFNNETSFYLHPFLGGNSLAIDEAWVKQVHSHLFFEGTEIDSFLNSIDGKSSRKLFILGTSSQINECLPILWDKVQNQKLQIFWSLGCDGDTVDSVSKKIPFLFELLEQKKNLEDSAAKKYFKDYDIWNELESYEKAKIPAPQKPSINFTIIENFKIKSFAKLSNHQELMIHLECPPWIDLNAPPLVLSVDGCWNMQTMKKSYHQMYMPNQTHGVLSYDEKSVDDELAIREDIIKRIFSFFSKVD
ncbi:MAG: hypothetical protein QE271_05960 [Bacteriovoracaceae bacterium]|nr:hypothetical protein [Bacteriovoracaceae bacterium]